MLSPERRDTSFYILDWKPMAGPTDQSKNTTRVTLCEPKHFLGLLTEACLRVTYGSSDDSKAATSLKAHRNVVHDSQEMGPQSSLLDF